MASVALQLAAPTTAASAAVFADVGFTYPTGTVALAGLDLIIPSGRVTGIVGPSGCGKTTVLKLLARLAVPTAGRVALMVDASEDRHDVAMVFQKDTLLPWLTVTENVGLYYRFHRPANRQQVKKEIQELLAMVGLEQFANAYPSELSGGMLRRVAFLAAVAPRPQLLLLDEAFSSLDEPTRVLIHQEVLRIVRHLGMTMVLVTHDLGEAISLSDQVVILSARPGHVTSVYEMPFGDDRNVLELRDQPQFLRLYGQLWHDLSKEIVGSQQQQRND